MYPYYFDWTYILILIGAAISGLASSKLRSTFSKYSRVASSSNMAGKDVARMILDHNGLNHITVKPVAGNLTDHYDPRRKTISLSEPVYNSTSLAAVCVAAHECGHAVQDKKEYTPYNIRSAIVPAVNIGQWASMPILMAGLIIPYFHFLIPLGIFLFSFSLIFQLVTLPVEYNASSRALQLLEQYGILQRNEMPHGKNVLSAAALTYVAGVIAALMSLLRVMIIFGGRRRRN